MENNELNNVAEEIVENTTEVAKATFAEKHPYITSFGVMALMGSGIYAGVLVSGLAVKGIKKLVNKVKEAKAQKEVSDNSNKE